MVSIDGGGDAAKQSASTVPTVTSTTPKDQAENVDLSSDVTVLFSTNMDPATTIAAVTFAPAVACQARVVDGLYSCSHPAFTPNTAYQVTVHGSARATSGFAMGADTSFSFTTQSAGITSVVIDGTTDAEVRQGVGLVSILVTGLNLGSVTSAKLGSLPAQIAILSDTQLTLSATIAHGQTLGGQAVSLVTPSGTVVAAKAVTVTPISVAAGAGSDAAAGTTSRPFATMTHAMSLARSGDTVTLADGIYSAGESWPQGIVPASANIPDGITLTGTSLNKTILIAPPGSSALTALAFAGSAQVSNLQIQGFARGVVATNAGEVAIGNARIHDNTTDGVYASGAAGILLGNVEIDSNTYVGVNVDGQASAALTSCNVHGNATGAYLAGDAQLTTLLGSGFSGNGRSLAATASGVFITGAASARLVSTVTDNYAAGVYSESSGALTLEGTYANNGTGSDCTNNPICSGVVLTAQASLTVQGEVSSNRSYGVVSNAPHPIVAINGATFSENGIANALFNDVPGPVGYTEVTIADATFSNSGTGIAWSDGVALTMNGGGISGDSFADLASYVAEGGISTSFTDVSFGLGAAAEIFPAFGSVTVTQTGSATGGPSWFFQSPSALHNNMVFTTTQPRRKIARP